MKLMCNVEVNNRLAAVSDCKIQRKKPQRSCLAIGRSSVKSNEPHMLLQTLQNKQGTTYRVRDNINAVFTKFVDSGKATIRFVEPPHDLILQSDAIQLKSFLLVLKQSLNKNANLSVLSVSSLKPKQIASALKIKVVVKTASEYPVLQGFPRTTEVLHIVDLGRKSFDRQILKLQNLRVLNISHNKISSLPNEIGSLRNLQELFLAGNNLGKSPLSKWSWLNSSRIAENLRLLDLSSNGLTALPKQIGKLGVLVTLNLSSNSLSLLPQSIGSLRNLKYLNLSKNVLLQLPGSMRSLRLDSLDISDNNNFTSMESCYGVSFTVPSLVEIAARAVIRTRKHYNASIIPLTLVTYLDDARYCMCGSPCFECHIRKSVHLDLSSISHTVTSTASYLMPSDCYFCSQKCLRRYTIKC